MKNKTAPALVIHAPNVHHGGGLTLLKLLLVECAHKVKFAQVDTRAAIHLEGLLSTSAHYVEPSIKSRISAELRLRSVAKPDDIVLCFHSLPPLFRLRATTIVFLQNRILVTREATSEYSFRTRIRFQIERFLIRTFARNVKKFIVQTPSMKRDARLAIGDLADIVVAPYYRHVESDSSTQDAEYDFVYVASDEPHKNHMALLSAWRLLGEQGHKPSLALTVARDSTLANAIESFKQKHQLDINNLGKLPLNEINRLYNKSSALIFPSYTESLGLPLIEAAQKKLPILAPELDYVRDIVDPIQTFDPHSPVSIARAVRRYLGFPDTKVSLKSPAEFLQEILK